jgi:hypothetical protein
MGLAGSHVLAGEEALRSLSSNSICGVWWGLIVAVFSIMVCPLKPFVACFRDDTDVRSRTLENGANCRSGLSSRYSVS